MVIKIGNIGSAEVQDYGGVRRRGLLRFGTLVTAITGASAVSALAAGSAAAAPGDKTPPNTYVPVAEKGSPSGVATLDSTAKLLPDQLPDLSTTFASKAEVRVTVAASDSAPRAKARADHVCTGTGDLAVIQAALDELPDNNAVSGEVVLLAGNYQDATGGTVAIGSPSSAALNPRKILRFQRGARLNVSGRTGRKAVLKVESPDCQIINANVSNSEAFGNGTGIAIGGDISTFGGRWDRVCNRVTIWQPILSNLTTGIEFCSIDGGPGVGGSSGDCNVHGGYLFQNQTAIRAAGYTNTVYSPTLAYNNVGVWVESRRVEAQLRCYGLTLVGWNEVGIKVDGGYGSTFHDTWMEHVSPNGSTASEAIRLGLSSTTRTHLTRFAGTTTLQLANEAYGVRYVGAVGTKFDNLVFSTSGAVPSASLIRNEGDSNSKGNEIDRITFGPNGIPSHSVLSIDPAAWGDVFINRIPGTVGSPGFSSRVNTSTRASRSPVVRKPTDTSKTADAVLSSDPDMTIALAPATNYALTGLIIFDASQDGDFKMQLSISAANGTVQWAGTGPASSHTSSVGISSVTTQQASSGFVQAWGGAASGTPIAVPIAGIVKTLDLATLTMKWAQNTADPTPTILKNGSWLKLEPIP
ncbi:hypothetical protein [Pseudarthrobacter sp. fls2-241-R2A-168]|uniref:hypothetical protein n=1 Tax=Pseudarthrobacter sp. fls2-241-R2A-168 TaxID=3040304 RepID=UPI0025546051|nr:hypothetical protein [Pseudarthrobacter sp. fls2-241-R2A-168]